jgi:hypothetical protein
LAKGGGTVLVEVITNPFWFVLNLMFFC